jgi:hypothetical protein
MSQIYTSWRLQRISFIRHISVKNMKIKTFKTLIVQYLLLCKCEKCSHIPREGYRERVGTICFRSIFGGNSRRLAKHTYLSSLIIRTVYYTLLAWRNQGEWGGWAWSMHGETRKGHRTLDVTAEGSRPLGTPRQRWEDNIKLDRKEIWCEGVDWIHQA